METLYLPVRGVVRRYHYSFEVEVPYFGKKPESDSGFGLHLLVDLPLRGSVLFGDDLRIKSSCWT
jgi:hypothetical protein